MSMSKMTQITRKSDGWRSVRIRSPLVYEIEKTITKYKEFGIKKWDSRTNFVEEAVKEKLAKVHKNKQIDNSREVTA